MNSRILATAFFLCSLPAVANASELKICNETGEDLSFAVTYTSYNEDYKLVWTTDGWQTVKHGSCWWENIRGYTFIFAFLTKSGENPIYRPRSASEKAPFTKMCVDRKKKEFRYGYFDKVELIGKDCEADTIDVSFGVSGGVNDVELTLK